MAQFPVPSSLFPYSPARYPPLVPVYEYRCNQCKRMFSALIGMVAEPDEDKCPHCESTSTVKLISRFSRFRSEDDRVDDLADRLEGMPEPEEFRPKCAR